MSRTSTESLPPAARAIALLLASTPTVQDAQQGVLHQLLEFSHRYTAQALSDALVYAEHAGRPNKVEMDDITLAVQARVGWEFGGRIPKEVGPLLDMLLFFFFFLRAAITYFYIDACTSLYHIVAHPLLGHADQRTTSPTRARSFRPPLTASK